MLTSQQILYRDNFVWKHRSSEDQARMHSLLPSPAQKCLRISLVEMGPVNVYKSKKG